MDLLQLLGRHGDTFNHGVRTGDFEPMLEMYHSNAHFERAEPVNAIYHGRIAIGHAYITSPPPDTMRVRSPKVQESDVAGDYVWVHRHKRIAGRLTLEFDVDALITRMLLTFASNKSSWGIHDVRRELL